MHKLKSILTRDQNDKIRFDIQAMRALAVLVVVVYHIWPNRLPGGFMGVDIFFVISGYLITLTIWKSIKVVQKAKKQKFSESIKFLFNFYARRIKRLAPAATVCLLVVLATIYAIGNFGLQQTTATQVIKSSIFMQNWHLADEAVDYLGQDNSATAMQHFWSLSIEEQFYMVWPLLLLVCGLISVFVFKRVKKKIAKWGGANLPLIIISLLTIATFVYGYWLTRNNAAAAYFVTPARIWELSLGGVIAFLPALKNRDLRLLLPWLGLAMCCYAIWKWNGVGFPGWHALVPTIGTALIIYAGGQKLEKNDKFFLENLAKFRPAQFFGDISYSLYLYHWPLIILLPIILGSNWSGERWQKICLAILSVLLAWLSYKFVENSTRHFKLSSAKVWLGGVICLLLVLIPAFVIEARASRYVNDIYDIIYDKVTNNGDECLGARAMQNQDRCGNPFDKTDKNFAQFATTIFMATKNHPRQNEMMKLCDNNATVNQVDMYCAFGDVDSSKTILIMGDSYSEQWYSAFDAMGRKLGYKVIGANSISCGGGTSLLETIDFYETRSRSLSDCNNRYNWIKSNLWAKADVVVIAQSPEYIMSTNIDDQTRDRYIASIVRTIEEFNSDFGIKPILLQSIPALPAKSEPTCINEKNCLLEKDEQLSSMNLLYNKLQNTTAAEKFSYLKVENLFCDNHNCHTQIGGLPVYYNPGHINALFSVSTSDYMIDQISGML